MNNSKKLFLLKKIKSNEKTVHRKTRSLLKSSGCFSESLSTYVYVLALSCLGTRDVISIVDILQEVNPKLLKLGKKSFKKATKKSDNGVKEILF